MTAGLLAPGSDEWLHLFHTFAHSAFRLETLQNYGASGEDASHTAFRHHQPYLPSAGKDWWLSVVRAAEKRGASASRVHVVAEPLADYLVYEMCWAYPPNVAAGERVLIAAADPWPTGVGRTDFWLFDSAKMYRMHYTDDGAWIGVEPITAAEAVDAACRERDAAVAAAQPWAHYVTARPELASRVPQEFRP